MDSTEISEIKRHFGVVAERLEGQIRQVAEGVAGLDERLDRRFSLLDERIDRQFEETRAMIRLSYTELDRRLKILEEGQADLESRVERLEAR